MSNSLSQQTSASLLARLTAEVPDQADWVEFVRRYGELVYRWCRKWGLQEADAQDVTQEVLARLARKMHTFRYDPRRSFRAYVHTLTRYAVCNLQQRRRKPGAGSGDSQVAAVLQDVEARTDLARHLEEEFDQELLEEAMRQVRERVAAHTWEAFRLTALEGLSGAAAAGQLGLKVATVFKAKSKVRKMLREALQELGAD